MNKIRCVVICTHSHHNLSYVVIYYKHMFLKRKHNCLKKNHVFMSVIYFVEQNIQVLSIYIYHRSCLLQK